MMCAVANASIQRKTVTYVAMDNMFWFFQDTYAVPPMTETLLLTLVIHAVEEHHTMPMMDLSVVEESYTPTTAPGHAVEMK